MNEAERFRSARQIFERVCELPPAERNAAVSVACGDDTELRRYVMKLLAYDEAPAGVIDDAVDGRVQEALANSIIPEAEETPDRVGEYRILRRIGAGGMGVVFEAQQESPDRRVALKVMRPGLNGSEIVARFWRETDLLGRLQHAGIANIFEAGVGLIELRSGPAGEAPYFAMELVDGRPLIEYAERHNPDKRARLTLIREVCDAVQHAHERGVIHRDLKPGNVLVTANGRPKVLDFGVARAASVDLRSVTLHTQAGQLIGTIPYMSPEQMLGDPSRVDGRCDVYSLGVLLFELLTGRLPHDLRDRSVINAIQVVQHEEPSRIGTINRDLKGDLDTLVAKALEKDPGRRYASVAALGEDIRRYLADEPLNARPASKLYQSRKFARRHKVLVGGIFATILSLSLGLVGVIWFALGESAARQEAQRFAAANQRAAYHAGIAAAAAARESDVAAAERYLRDTPVALRGWEWDYLHNSLDQSGATLPLTDDPADVGPLRIMRGISHAWFSADDRLVHIASLGLANQATLSVNSFDHHTHTRVSHWSLPAISRFAPFGEDALYVESQNGETSIRDLLTGETRRRSDPISFPGQIQSAIPPGISPIDPALFGDMRGNANALSRTTLSPDGRTAVVARRNRVILLRGAGFHQESQLELQPEGMSNAAFSSDGRRLATAGFNRTQSMFSMEDQVRLMWRETNAQDDAILAVAFSPDDTIVATGGQDRQLVLRDVETGRRIARWIGHREPILAIGFSHDGRHILTSSATHARFWDTGMVDADDVNVMKLDMGVHRLLVSPDGSVLAAAAGDALRFWDTTTGVRLGSARVPAPINRIRFDESGARFHVLMESGKALTLQLATGKWDQQVTPIEFFQPGGRLVVRMLSPPRLIDAQTSRVMAALPEKAKFFEFGAEGRRLFFRTLTTVFAYDLRSLQVERQWGSAGRTILPLSDGRSLATANLDSSITIFDVETGAIRGTLRGHTAMVKSMIELPNQGRLVSGSDDRTVRIWDLNAMAEVIALRGHADAIQCLAASPDETTIFSGSGDYTIRRWDTRPLSSVLQNREAYHQIAKSLRTTLETFATSESGCQAANDWIEHDASLSARQRQIARQLLLQRALMAIPFGPSSTGND